MSGDEPEIRHFDVELELCDAEKVASGRERSSSQFGEDLIVARLLDDAEITGAVGEFGAGDGEHLSNSALFRRRGWAVVLAESDRRHVPALTALHRPGDVMSFEPVTVDNVDELFGPCDAFVSVDVDGDDYLLAEALLASGARPAVLCIEFNQTIPWWLNVHPTVPGSAANRVGCSAWALAKLGLSAGYRVAAVTECNVILASTPTVRSPTAASLSTLSDALGDAPDGPSPLAYLVTNYDGVPYRLGPEPPWGLTLPIDHLSTLEGYVS